MLRCHFVEYVNLDLSCQTWFMKINTFDNDVTRVHNIYPVDGRETMLRYFLCLPSEEVGTFWFIFVRSVCPLSLCLCVRSVYRAGGQTRDVDPVLG